MRQQNRFDRDSVASKCKIETIVTLQQRNPQRYLKTDVVARIEVKEKKIMPVRENEGEGDEKVMKRLTHQDGQHNVLEVISQVGSVSAEEDKVALHQL